MLDSYQKHVEERSALGIVPKPLDAEQTAALVELLKSPPAGKEELLLSLVRDRVPAGVDQAAYVKAGFLAAIVGYIKYRVMPTAENEIELLGSDGGVLA